MPEFKTNFQSIDTDIDRWMTLHGTPDTLSDGTPVLRGIDKANDFILNLYFDNEAWDPLIDRLGTTDCSSREFTRLNDALVERRDLRRLKRLWSTVIAERKLRFWEYHAFCGKARVPHSPEARFYEGASSEAKLANSKTKLLETLDHARRLMSSLGDEHYALQLSETYQAVQNETRTKPLPKPLSRAMDEPCFWELIEAAKQSSQSSAEQLDHLLTALERFKATEIKKFRQILDTKMDALLHWDIWALAYVAMDGCSDDAFESFRCWLILQGPDDVETALRDVQQLDLPNGPYSADGLLALADVAYENRSGKPLRLPKRKPAQVQGHPWKEADLPSRYPHLASRFST